LKKLSGYIFLLLFLIGQQSLHAQKDSIIYGLQGDEGNKGKVCLFSYNLKTNEKQVLYSFQETIGNSLVGSQIQMDDSIVYFLDNDDGVINSYNISSKKVSTLLYIYKVAYSIPIDYNKAKHKNHFLPYEHPKIIKGNDGNMYGLSSCRDSSCCSGILFGFDTKSLQYKVQHVFTDTDDILIEPNSDGLIQGKDGNLYGFCFGGSPHYYGVFFEYNLFKKEYKALIKFNGDDGDYPYGDIIQTQDGKLYGVTTQGGNGFGKELGDGVMYCYNPVTGEHTTVVEFDAATKGSNPTGDLIIGKDGCIYGIAEKWKKDILFRYNPVTTKYDILLIEDDASTIKSIMQAPDGNIYMGVNDTTGGAIIKLNPSTQKSTVVFKLGKEQYLLDHRKKIHMKG
jgi:hypothetical protein